MWVEFVHRAAAREILGATIGRLTRPGREQGFVESEFRVRQELVLQSFVTASTDQAISQHVVEYGAEFAMNDGAGCWCSFTRATRSSKLLSVGLDGESRSLMS